MPSGYKLKFSLPINNFLPLIFSNLSIKLSTQLFRHYSYAYFCFSNARNITHACEISFTRIPFQATISESFSRSPVNFCRDCVSASVSARVLITSWVAHNLIPKSHFSVCFLRLWYWELHYWVSQVALEVKNLPANAGGVRDMGSMPGPGRVPGGGRGNPLQYSWLENPMDRGASWATVHGVTKIWTRLKQLNTHIAILVP